MNMDPQTLTSHHRALWLAAFAVFVTLVVASSGATFWPQKSLSPTYRPESPAEMQIDAGRLDAIMRNMESVLDTARFRAGASASEQRREMADVLVESVVRFNANAVRACRARAVPALYCGGPYTPGWLYRPRSEIPSQSQLQTMLSDAQARIEPFWRSLCARGMNGRDTYAMCQME